MSQVFITRRIFPEALDLLDQAGLDYHHNEADLPLSRAEIQEQAAGVVALVCLLTDTIDVALMGKLPRLRVIANVAVGYDNIDLDAATERGIVVTNTPGVLTECAADLTFALLLAVARRVVEADQYVRAGAFKGWELFQPHLGTDVFGKTLGIVGLGRIGTAVARRGALGFGMKVIYADRLQNPDAERELGIERVPFSRLLRESDFISIHTPLSPETRHMFTRQQFMRMKPSSFLINTARGPIIHEGDLVEALQNGTIQGAALDVFEQEPEIHPGLLELKQHVIIVPHIGSASVETRRGMCEMAVSNAIAATHGEMPANALNPEAWSE